MCQVRSKLRRAIIRNAVVHAWLAQSLVASISGATATPVGIGGGGALFAPVISPSSPKIMFVACDMTGLYRSSDGGSTWVMQDTRVVSGSDRFSVAFDPSTPAHVVAMHRHQGLKESWNYGQQTSWNDYPYPLPNFPDTYVVTAAGFADDGTLHVGTTQGIYTMINNNWVQTLPPGTDETYTACGAGAQQTVNTNEIIKFASAQTPGAAKSTMYAATVKEIYQYSDVNSSWTAMGPPGILREPAPFRGNWCGSQAPYIYHASRIRGFAAADDANHAVLYTSIVTDPTQTPDQQTGGVYRYELLGAGTSQWIREVDGLGWAKNPNQTTCGFPFVYPIYEHLAVARHEPNTPYVSTVQTTCSPDVYKGSWNSGIAQISWVGVYDGYQNDPATNLLSPGWIDMQPPYGFGWPWGGSATGFTVDPEGSNVALFTNLGVIHVTTNGATSWSRAYTNLAVGSTQNPNTNPPYWNTVGIDVTGVHNYIIHPYLPNIHFLLNTDIGLLRSTDSGSTWQPVVGGWSNCYDLTFDSTTRNPPHVRILAAFSAQHDIPQDTQLAISPSTGSGAVLYSDGSADNDGQTWHPLSAPGNGLPVVSLTWEGSNTLYASVWGSPAGVYKSINRGQTWAPYGAGISGSSPFAYKLRWNPEGLLHVSVSADRRSGTLQPGALYRRYNGTDQWVRITDNLRDYLSGQGAVLAPMDYTFNQNITGSVYMCTGKVTGAGNPIAGGCWQYSSPSGTWTNLNIPFSSRNYWGVVVAFAPHYINNAIYATSVTHGIWTNQTGTWTEYTAIPFLLTQRILTPQGPTGPWYIATLGGGAWKVQ